MVVILVILTIALFFLMDWLLSHKEEPLFHALSETAKATWPPQLSAPVNVAGFKVQNEMAYHPGHTWAFTEGPARARVGMDDFAHRLIGKVDKIDLPKPGDWIVQGAPVWTVRHGDRTVTMLSPVTGEVLEVNPRARQDASVIAETPYAEGWLLRVRTHELRANLNNLLKGEFVTKWMETLSAQLRMRLSPGLVASYPDGGRAVSDISALVPDEQWKEIVKDFFLTET